MSPDGRRGLFYPVVINSPPPTDRICANVRPAFATSGAINGSSCNSINYGQFTSREVAQADFLHGIISKFSISLPHAERLCSVPFFVEVILLWGRPTEIISTIVAWISVIMRRLVPIGRWLSMENCCDNTVQPEFAILPAGKKPNVLVSIPASVGLPQSRTPIRRRSHIGTKSPERTNRITVRERYRQPDFSVSSRISHGAVPSRYGQGRALLKQRFRPAFYSRNQDSSQECGVI